jgi:hypothetical protein
MRRDVIVAISLRCPRVMPDMSHPLSAAKVQVEERNGAARNSN